MCNKSIYVILVNYNGLRDTEDCIESIKHSTYRNYKIVVVDNCSPNNDAQKLKVDYDDIILINNKENEGFAKANNRGIDVALQNGADYVMLLNNDTIVEADFLEKMIDTAQELAADLLTCKIMYNYDRSKIWYGGGGINWKKGYGVHYTNDELKEISEIEFASGCCMLLARRTIEKLKLPEDYFMYFEDVDYCAKLKENGFHIFYTPFIKLYHKVSASSGVESPFFVYYWNRNRLIFMKKYRSKIGRIQYDERVFIFFLTRIMKSVSYMINHENEKNKKMIEGIKEGWKYNVKTGASK